MVEAVFWDGRDGRSVALFKRLEGTRYALPSDRDGYARSVISYLARQEAMMDVAEDGRLLDTPRYADLVDRHTAQLTDLAIAMGFVSAPMAAAPENREGCALGSRHAA